MFRLSRRVGFCPHIVNVRDEGEVGKGEAEVGLPYIRKQFKKFKFCIDTVD